MFHVDMLNLLHPRRMTRYGGGMCIVHTSCNNWEVFQEVLLLLLLLFCCCFLPVLFMLAVLLSFFFSFSFFLFFFFVWLFCFCCFLRPYRLEARTLYIY